MKKNRLFLSIVGICLAIQVHGQIPISGALPEIVFDANTGPGDGGDTNIISVDDVDDRLYYEANATLWMYNGTTVNEVELGAASYGHLVGHLNGSIYFVASEVTTRRTKGVSIDFGYEVIGCITAIDDESLYNTLKLYPNPTTDKLSLIWGLTLLT